MVSFPVDKRSKVKSSIYRTTAARTIRREAMMTLITYAGILMLSIYVAVVSHGYIMALALVVSVAGCIARPLALPRWNRPSLEPITRSSWIPATAAASALTSAPAVFSLWHNHPFRCLIWRCPGLSGS